MPNSLKTLIKNELEKDKTLATKLANIGGFKNATPLYKFLNEPEREMESLLCLFRMVEHLFSGKTDEILNRYFSTINPNGKFARQALEYCATNDLPIGKLLLEKMKNGSNGESNEWALIYSMMCEITKNPIGCLKKLTQIKTKTTEMTALKSILVLSCYYYMDNIHMVEIMSHTIEEEIALIKNNEFIKTQYYIRLYKSIAILYHHKNKIIQSREYADKVLNICEDIFTYILAATYQIKGMTYLFENFDTGDELLLKAYEYYKMSPNRYDGEIKSSLNLNRAFWNKPMFEMKVDGDVHDKHDAILYFVKNNDIVTAKRVMDTINEEGLYDRDKAFHCYSKGIIYNDLNCFYESIKQFKMSGDKFYINFPIIELKQRGFDHQLLNLFLL